MDDMRVRTFALVVFSLVVSASCGGGSGSGAGRGTTAGAGGATGPAALVLDQAGELAEGDMQLGQAYSDPYEIPVEAGTRLAVILTSDDFDPVLEVIPPGGGSLVNDDWEGDRHRSRVDLVTEVAGSLKVRVTSYAPGARGRYRLQIERAQPVGEGEGVQPGGPVVTALLGPGQELAGQVGPGDPTLPEGLAYDALSVNNPPGRSSQLTVTVVDGSAPRLTVMAPSGRFLSAQGGSVTLSEAGVHRVQVIQSAPGQQVSYRARLSGEASASTAGATPNLERNHHLPPAVSAPSTAVQLGQQLRGELAASDQRLPSGEQADVYTLSATAGQSVSLEMNSSVIDTYLMLLGPAGQLWENDDVQGTTNSHIAQVLPQSGTYRIVATSYRAGEAGAYELKVFGSSRIEQLPGGEAPGSPAGGGGRVERTGTLAAGDAQLRTGEYYDEHTFVFQQGQRVSIQLTSTEFDTYLIFKPPTGEQQDNDDVQPGNTNSAMDVTITQSGPHRVLVTSYRPGETGVYRLVVSGTGSIQEGGPPPAPAPGPTPAPPQPDQAGWRTVRGNLSSSDHRLPSGEFYDEYEMPWPAGTSVRLEARSTDFDTFLIVRSPGGRQQQNDDQSSGNTNAALSLVTEESGRHTVIVTSYRAGEQGAYELLIGAPGGSAPTPGPGPGPAPAPPPNPGPVQERRITGQLARNDSTLPSGEFVDYHDVQLPAGRAVSLRLTSRQFDPYLLVRTPGGRTVQNDDMSPGTRDSGIDLPAAEAGTYRIGVTSYRPGETGSYTLSIGRGESVPGPGPGGGGPDGGRVWGLFAGITDYPGSGNDLPECANDAIKLAQTLRNAGLLTPDRQVLLTDSQATLGNVRAGMQRLAQRMGPNDTFIFFYSGHGGQRPGSRDPRELDGIDETLVLYDQELVDDELGRLFDLLHTRVSMLALDACFAGGFAKDVITRPGRMGMFSSEEDVLSAVASQFQAGGYLSYFLRQGLAGNADMGPQDRVLTAGELTHYVYQQFATHARDVRMQTGYQQLVVDRGAVRPDFVLWRYN